MSGNTYKKDECIDICDFPNSPIKYSSGVMSSLTRSNLGNFLLTHNEHIGILDREGKSNETITKTINHSETLFYDKAQLNLIHSNNEQFSAKNDKYELYRKNSPNKLNKNSKIICESCQRAEEFFDKKSKTLSESNLINYCQMGHYQSKKIGNCIKQKNISVVALKSNNEGFLELEIINLRDQLKISHDEIEEKNKQIESLQREINKLKSVLDQTKNVIESTDLLVPEFPNRNRSKKQGVSGESSKDHTDLKLIKFKKDSSIKELLRESILKNLLLSNLPIYQVKEMIEYMYARQIDAGCHVINEGEEGDHLYVAEHGEFEVWKGERFLCKLNQNLCFGELALLYNCKRTASVKTLTDSKLWVLDREVFQVIMMRTGMERQAELLKFLKSVSLLKGLPEGKLNKLLELLEIQRYEQGECIIRQGESADCFFIIQSGSVKVTQKYDGQEEILRTLSMGEYFGEKALLSADTRTASVYADEGGAEVLSLYRKPFLELIGDLNELKNKNYEDEKRILSKSNSKSSLTYDLEIEKLQNIRLKDLELVCTLGVGGFGRVELVRLAHDHQSTYALKCMKKYHIVQTKQQEHVVSEKKILMNCRSNFICRLYKTFKDIKFVYMLTEVCLGGELWTCLRERVYFDDTVARFCLGCVLEAFDYLHSRGIIYRDLKPENLLITVTGYLKLCDFGFAKKIGIGKRTWTFCGTPEYVSPEIILNKGHDFTSDYWSVGILTYELLTGTPPFTGNDPMKIYTLILKGVEATDIFHNRRITFRAANFIVSLCKFTSAERLGNGSGGLEEIRAHRYFQGFDWDSLRRLELESPFHPKVTGPVDHSNFDDFQEDDDLPPDEYSLWDEDF